MSDILPESALISKYLMTKFFICRIFQKKRCGGEWYLLDFSDIHIDIHNGVETNFWLRHYFVWYIAWNWPHLLVFIDKISHLQNFSEKPLWWRVISFRFLRCRNWCPQRCLDGFLIKALFCLIYCLKLASYLSI